MVFFSFARWRFVFSKIRYLDRPFAVYTQLKVILVVSYAVIRVMEKGVPCMGCFSCAFGSYFCVRSSYKKKPLKILNPEKKPLKPNKKPKTFF